MVSAASRKRLRDMPSPDDMRRLLADLKSHGDASVALWAAAYLEHALQAYLLIRFTKLNDEDVKRLFDGSAGGILGSFHAKIRIAHAMGCFNEHAKEDMILINDIRNVFAHSLHTMSFDDPLIAQDCDKFWVPKESGPFSREGKPFAPTCARDKFLLTFHFIYAALRFAKGDRDMVQDVAPIPSSVELPT